MDIKKVEVRLFGHLRDNRGKVIYLNFNTVGEVLNYLKIYDKDSKIILINSQVASKDTKLNNGDVLSILPQMGGG